MGDSALFSLLPWRRFGVRTLETSRCDGSTFRSFSFSLPLTGVQNGAAVVLRGLVSFFPSRLARNSLPLPKKAKRLCRAVFSAQRDCSPPFPPFSCRNTAAVTVRVLEPPARPPLFFPPPSEKTAEPPPPLATTDAFLFGQTPARFLFPRNGEDALFPHHRKAFGSTALVSSSLDLSQAFHLRLLARPFFFPLSTWPAVFRVTLSFFFFSREAKSGPALQPGPSPFFPLFLPVRGRTFFPDNVEPPRRFFFLSREDPQALFS